MAKAIISSTYDDKYLYFLPIATWLWNKLGVDVVCFMPDFEWDGEEDKKFNTISEYLVKSNLRCDFRTFKSPKHKEATYSQCARLYGACLDLPEDEILITGDVDMAVFSGISWLLKNTDVLCGRGLHVYGNDLVPYGQYPMCYITGTVKEWRNTFGLSGKTYQQCLDELLGHIEAEHFRGNYWGKDQEEAWNKINPTVHVCNPRAKPGTQFAQHRVDRDDINWRAYVNEELIDAHLWRPGYADGNFENIIELLTIKYPDDDFTWLKNYNQQYKQLL